MNTFYIFVFIMGERRGSNPRMMESQSIALPLGYARHKIKCKYSYFYFMMKKNFILKKENQNKVKMLLFAVLYTK